MYPFLNISKLKACLFYETIIVMICLWDAEAQWNFFLREMLYKLEQVENPNNQERSERWININTLFCKNG